MQQLFPPSLCDIANCSLSNAILEVGIDTTIGEMLLPLIAMCNEGIVHEASIVCMIVLDSNMVVAANCSKANFALRALLPDTCVIMYVY